MVDGAAQRMRSLKRHAGPQQRLTIEEEQERRRLESDRRYWDKRLGAIDRELSEEPARIQVLYEFKATRIEPVGLVHLWPATG